LTNSPDSRERKRALRAELIQVRAKLSRQERDERSRAIGELNTEVDPGEIARRLLASGARIAWPRVQTTGRILTFAACDLNELTRGPLGALEPPPTARAVQLDEIEAVVMPGVAFSVDGLRLGRGGGYYDATLKLVPVRALRIGLGFDVQIVPSLPREPHDVPLDAVVTEARTLRFAR
jgi:5-formyltetrahydrofolate cyclo-ligase